MPNILVTNNFYQGTSQACIVDLTPPTFAGINFLDVESRGQIRAKWAAATDPNVPIRYEIYIKASTATGLFSTSNIVALTPNLQYDIFTLPDGSFLQEGTTYYVGVRAIDALSNQDGNTISLNVISTGILTSIDVYECKAAYSINNSNQFQLTMWANKNESIAKSPDAVLGTASYQVYDKAGNAIVGMSGSGISANAEGLFVAPNVSNLLSETAEHYQIKISITIDSEVRTNFIDINGGNEIYSVDGVVSIDVSDDVVGSVWITENEKILTSGLGTASYQVYEADGTIVPSLTESGIVADVNGYFSITPISLPLSFDRTQSYIARITVSVNGKTRSHNLPIYPNPAVYSAKATFSINALNQLQATFWATINGNKVDTAILGTASYTIYDATGNAVAGLTQAGITADPQGLYFITPVSAALLTDLTHYTAKVTINVVGADRVVFKGFSLLGN